MSTELYDLMIQHEDELIERLVQRLRASSAPHYLDIDINLLERRAANVVEAFLIALAEDPGSFVAYIREIAEERLAEGFLIGEVQCALNVLEENAWKIVVAHAVLQDQVGYLSLITGTVGAAKDALARVYLNRMEVALAKTDRLERKIDELSNGAVDGASLDDEFPRLES